MKYYIPERQLIGIIDRVKSGSINPDLKTYVLRMYDGQCIGFEATNEKEAWDKATERGYRPSELIDVEEMLYNGLTLREVKLEAHKRGLESF